jgi:hypothetical protein
MMERDVHSKSPIRERAIVELREYFILATYLWICFSAVAYLKAAILEAHGIVFAPWFFAVIKALLSAKFMMLGRMLHVGEGRRSTQPLIVAVLRKSLALMVFLMVLTALEEVVVSLLHDRSAVSALTGFGGGTVDQLIATCFVLMLIFIPYFAFRALGEVLGERDLLRLFFQRRPRTGDALH